MVSAGLLDEVRKLDRSDQMELVGFIYEQTDDGTLAEKTKAILSRRMDDLRENPADEADLSETMDTLRSTWQHAFRS